MVEIIGDVVQPSDFIVPRKTRVSGELISGELILSGDLLFFGNSAGVATVVG